MIYPQMLLDLNRELLIDLFAGGGGASCGIEMALGRTVDVAVNHDPAAVAMHAINHPQTRHLTSDVFEVDPRTVTQGRPVGLLWASPDCTYHSKARGGKPIRDANRKRRALAWVVTRWAGQVRPRVILLENVEEFADWGPLVGPPDQLRPDPKRRGRTFRQWKRSLERMGYQVEHRELRASDYGAPTIRKRLFLIARCDGEPIVWPEPTHGPGRAHPYRTAAECIDWSIPMLSVFATREEARAWGRAHGQAAPVRPLADATMRRVARGIERFVLNNPEPFIVGVGGRAGQSAPRSLRMPYQTITAKGDAALVAPVLTECANASRQRVLRADEPLRTQVAGVKGGHFALAAAFLAKHFTGVDGADLRQPAPTVTTVDHNALVAAHLVSYHAETRGDESRGALPNQPLATIDTANRHAVVASFLTKYYGEGIGQPVDAPGPTVTTKDRMGLVTVEVQGGPYVITDIAMRMLQPGELYRCQGFPASYVFDRGEGGRRLTKTEQVRMVGNSVSPPAACALVRANVPDMIVRDDVITTPRRRRREAVAA